MSHASQVITVVVLAIVALIGVAILGPVAGIVTDSSTVGGGSTALEPAPSDPETVDNLQDADAVRVEATTANALYLGGGGSYVDDPTDASVVADGGWTVAMVADPDENALDADTTATLYAADNETAHLLLEEGNWTARYESGTASAYVEAPADLDGRTPVAASYNTSSGELELFVDGTLADSAPLTATTEPRSPAYSWVGSIDEVRTWNASLTPTQQASYAASPVRPLATETAAARLMFNENRLATVYYAPGDATINGDTELVDGVAGPDLVAGDDYLVDTDAETIETTSDGAVADAPVLFVGVGGVLGDTASSVIGGIASAVDLIPILLLGIMATIVLSVVGRLRSGV